MTATFGANDLPVPGPSQRTALRLRAIHTTQAIPLPFQYPSVGHLVAAAEHAIRATATLEGQSATTTTWLRGCLHTFATFLASTRADRAFLSGDVRRQAIVIENWVAGMRERGLARTTIRTYWNALHAICTRLSRQDGVLNPFALFEPPKIGPLHPRLLTREHAERLLLLASNYRWRTPLQRTRNVAIIGLMLLAGLRRGEVLRLLVSDIEIERGTIRVRRGKGRHGGKDRTAYAPEQLQEILERYLAERDRAGRTHPEFITSTIADAPITATGVKRLFELLSRVSGMRVSPHMLRHTYATLLRSVGVPDRVAMDLMGHASLTMLKRYSHVFEEEYAVESRKLRLDVDL
ncbi:MAG TPA: site-specific integrase [Thermoanaerobaculia bacterium]|nr:site-specific integrase [Thermoanaerobaculia bacterium]